MWNCRVTCDRASSYGAYAAVFDNLLGFIIGSERSASTYIDLIEENRTIFLNATTENPKWNEELVEPRELLFLMNHLDTADRLYWAPRPYRRSGDVEKEFLFICPENDTLACIFCGFKCPLPLQTKRAPVVGGVTSPMPIPTVGNPTAGYQPLRGFLTAYSRQMRELLNDNGQQVGLLNDRRQQVLSRRGFHETDDMWQPEDESATGDQNAPVANANATANNRDQIEPSFTNENMTASGSGVTTAGKQPRFHFDKCPLMWLENYCTWKTKYSSYHIHEPSKFGNALDVLQRRGVRGFMATEMEWNEFVQLTSDIPVMGACEDTLLKCYRTMVRMKLDTVDRYHGDGREFRRLPLYAMYYDSAKDITNTMSKPAVCRPLACVLEHSPLYGSAYVIDKRRTKPVEQSELNGLQFDMIEEESLVTRINRERVGNIINENLESQNYLSHVLATDKEGSTSDPDVSHPTKIRVPYAIDMETAWRAFNMHGFCVQQKKDTEVADIYNVVASGEFPNCNNGAGYTIRHRIEVPTTIVLCIYCGFSFESKLCSPELVDFIYDKPEIRKSVAGYLLSRSSVPLPDDTSVFGIGSCMWWTRKPGPNSHLALSPNEVQKDPKESTTGKPLLNESNEEKTALWLSASLNNSHSSTCIFRMKKRKYFVEWCPVCLIEETTYKEAVFTCGHPICDVCENDIRITTCPLCNKGTRKRRIRVKTGLEPIFV